MKILIDIPEEVYEHAKEHSEDSRDEGWAMRAIEKGKVRGSWEPNLRFGMYSGESMYYCDRCRGQSNKKTRFCSNCGIKMEVER